MITSTANSRIKQIRKLRDHKERLKTGKFFIEGLRVVGEASEQGVKFDCLVYSSDLLTSEFGWQIVHRFIENHQEVMEVSGEVFKNISDKDGPQGIGAVICQEENNLHSFDLKAGDIWIALDSIQDPGNLGTILRTSDAVGGKGVILLDDSTDPYNPTAIRASMGALFSQKIIKTDLSAFAKWIRDNAFSVVATSDAAELDYQQYDYPDPIILLMGSEREGLHSSYYGLCDAIVRIPMVGKSDSLNLAIATGVVVYEIFNQRRARASMVPKLLNS